MEKSKNIRQLIGTGIIDIKMFSEAEPISERGYYESDEENQPRNDWFAYIELDNGYVIHENRMAPNGIGGANLFLYTQEQFINAEQQDKQ